MPLTTNEYVSLVPLGGLAIVYWLRDKYMYNRAEHSWHSSTPVQLKVLLIGSPLWVFLGWTLGLQTNRVHIPAALLTTVGQHIVGHYSVIGILNDSFYMTYQQLVSLFLGIGISCIWTTFWLIVSNSASCENEVSNVVNNSNECHCN